MLHYTFDDFGRISCDNSVGRNIPSDDSASADGSTHANFYAGKNSDVSGNPAVFLNDYWLAKLWSLSPVTGPRVEWVGTRVDVDVGPDECSGLNGHGAGIDDGATKVDKDTGAEGDVVTVVTHEGDFDPWLLIDRVNGILQAQILS